MLRVALLAAAVAQAALPATAAPDAAADSVTTSSAPADTPCHPGLPLELACALRVAHAGDAGDAPAELASLAPPVTTTFDWAPRPPADDLAFKDAATDTGSVLPASVDHDRSHRLAPALLALAALVLLLRRRPN